LPPPLPPEHEDDFDEEEEREDEELDERRYERRRRNMLQRARARVAPAAIGLIVVAAFDLLGAVGGIAFAIITAIGVIPGAMGGPDKVIFMVMGAGAGVLEGAFGVLILIGAMKMRRLQSYPWSMAAAILAIVSGFVMCLVAGLLGSCMTILGMIFGIWSLIILNDSQVKPAFK
jgi:hypothetical protein